MLIPGHLFFKSTGNSSFFFNSTNNISCIGFVTFTNNAGANEKVFPFKLESNQAVIFKQSSIDIQYQDDNQGELRKRHAD